MENLATVYNGSSGDTNSRGYWLLSVLGADVKGDELMPLILKIFSQEAEEFKSENEEITSAIKKVSYHVGKRGIWVIDRGGDRGILYKFLIQEEHKFVIRARSDRSILHKGKLKNILDVSKFLKDYSVIEIEINKEGQAEKKKLSIVEEEVFLPLFMDIPLKLVIIEGFGEEPTLLLTNLLDKTKEEILEIYLTRWKCEESFRFIKQSYNLEDIRVRNWQGLKNLVVLVLAVFYFISVELGKKLRLNILLQKIYQKAKRFFGIPSFKHYAIADGIYAFLFASIKGIDKFSPKPIPQNLTLPLPGF